MTAKPFSQKKPSSNTLLLLQQSFKSLEELLKRISMEKWPVKPRDGGWSISEVVHHLVSVEVQGLQKLKDIVEGRQESAVVDSANRPEPARLQNPRPKYKTISEYEPTTGIPAKYLLDGLRRARSETIAYAQKVGRQQLSKIGIHTPWLNAVNGKEFLECLAYHTERHTAQIARVIDPPQ
ncbi:MAG: DinB family protein [bacterium]